MAAWASNEGLLRIEVEDRGPAKIAHLIGSANMVASGDLKEQLIALADSDPEKLVLELSQLDFISSVGLGGIIAVHLRCRHQNTAITLVNPSPEIRELLDITNLTKLFPIHASVDDALAS